MKRSVIPTFDFQYAAASQFSGRPTLRQVTSEQLWTVLQEKLSWLAFVKPALSNADPLMLDSPEDRKSTRLNSSHLKLSRMPSSA